MPIWLLRGADAGGAYYLESPRSMDELVRERSRRSEGPDVVDVELARFE